MFASVEGAGGASVRHFPVRSHQTGFVTSMTASAKTFGACCGRAWPALGTRWWIRLPENLAAEDRPSEGRDDRIRLPVERDGGHRDDREGCELRLDIRILRIAGCQQAVHLFGGMLGVQTASEALRNTPRVAALSESTRLA